jgi:hypothetical protein
MKKKLSLLLTICMLTSLTLSGCANPIDTIKNKINGSSSSSNEEEVSGVQTSVTVIGAGEYEVGETVTIDDVISVNNDYAGSVTNKVFLDEMGSLVDTLDTSAEGSYAVSIVVEFGEEGSWSGSYSYFVNAPEVTLPDELQSNITNDSWATYYVQEPVSGESMLSESTESNVLVSYDTDKVTVNEGTSSSIYDSSVAGIWSLEYLPDNIVAEMQLNEISPFANEYSFNYMFQIIDTLAGSFDEDYVSIEDTDDPDVKVFGYLKKYVNSHSTVSTVNTPYSIYDTEGNAYPVSLIINEYNFGSESLTNDVAAYITVDGGRMLFKYTKLDYNSFTSIDEDEDDEDEEEAPTFESYEEFSEWLDEQFAAGEDTYLSSRESSFSTDLESYVSQAQYAFVIGDVTTAANDSNADDNMIDDTLTNDITVAEGTESIEGELVSVVDATKEGLYARKYPEIYNWEEKGTTYSRWNHLIDGTSDHSNSSYTGTIILSDGTVLFSGESDETHNVNGTSSSSSNEGTAYQNIQVTSLVSSYNTYSVSNQNDLSITFDTARSTSSTLYLSYNGNRYTIETARASTINNYKTNCIYSTSSFLGGAFEIAEDEYNLYTTDGIITSYNITYTNSNTNKSETKGYMSVYNLSNDYLVIYADNFDATTATMEYILQTVISE